MNGIADLKHEAPAFSKVQEELVKTSNYRVPTRVKEASPHFRSARYFTDP